MAVYTWTEQSQPTLSSHCLGLSHLMDQWREQHQWTMASWTRSLPYSYKQTPCGYTQHPTSEFPVSSGWPISLFALKLEVLTYVFPSSSYQVIWGPELFCCDTELKSNSHVIKFKLWKDHIPLAIGWLHKWFYHYSPVSDRECLTFGEYSLATQYQYHL